MKVFVTVIYNIQLIFPLTFHLQRSMEVLDCPHVASGLHEPLRWGKSLWNDWAFTRSIGEYDAHKTRDRSRHDLFVAWNGQGTVCFIKLQWDRVCSSELISYARYFLFVGSQDHCEKLQDPCWEDLYNGRKLYGNACCVRLCWWHNSCCQGKRQDKKTISTLLFTDFFWSWVCRCWVLYVSSQRNMEYSSVYNAVLFILGINSRDVGKSWYDHAVPSWPKGYYLLGGST